MKPCYGVTEVVTKGKKKGKRMGRQTKKTVRYKKNTNQMFTGRWKNSDTKENWLSLKVTQKKSTEGNDKTLGSGKQFDVWIMTWETGKKRNCKLSVGFNL